jgi:hypothetical protein
VGKVAERRKQDVLAQKLKCVEDGEKSGQGWERGVATLLYLKYGY